MQIDNSFKRDTAAPERGVVQPSAFQEQIHTLTYSPETDGPSVVKVRGEQKRMEDAAGGPPPANRFLVPDPPHPDNVSPDAPVTRDATNTPLLHPYAGQHPLRDYPGNAGTPAQIEQARKIIEHWPGPAPLLFESFDRNYDSRVDENHTPGELKLSDAPSFGPNARYQLHFDVDLYVKEDHGPLMPSRDMRPQSDGNAPGSGKRPDEFFAVVADKNNTPLDVLEYQNKSTGSRYIGQYVFKYHAVDDPTNSSVVKSEITVMHLVPQWLATSQAKDATPVSAGTNNRPNVIADETKYYYDSNHHCVQVELYSGAELKNKAQPAPLQTMKFNAGRVNGTTEERGQAVNFRFFDLLGPRLP